MIQLVEVLIALAVPAGVIVLFAKGGAVGLRARRRRHAVWRPNVRSLGPENVVVEVTRIGETAQEIATLDPGGIDFDSKLMDAQVRAENTARALNFAVREAKKIRQ